MGALCRKEFLRLYHLFKSNDLYFTSQGARAMIRKEADQSVLTSVKALENFLACGNSFFHHFIEDHEASWVEDDSSAWIEVISEGEEDIKCGVCGQSVYFNKVLCSSCDTPHHLDCWEYNGVCSVYGCGSRDYVFPASV
jgi:hypothetical protein